MSSSSSSHLCSLNPQELHKYKENEKDTEVLMSALSAMQDKTQHLENSLSAETRIKLDLFSALGDAKRQLEIAQGQLTHAHAHARTTTGSVISYPQGSSVDCKWSMDGVSCPVLCHSKNVFPYVG